MLLVDTYDYSTLEIDFQRLYRVKFARLRRTQAIPIQLAAINALLGKSAGASSAEVLMTLLL